MHKCSFKNECIIIICSCVVFQLFFLFLYFSFNYIFGPKYYSEKQIKEFTKTLVPDSSYIKKKKIKRSTGQTTYYLFKDSYEREFIIRSYSNKGLIFYGPKLEIGYTCCISQKNINEIEHILEDTGLKYGITGEALKMQNDMLKWATETPSLYKKDIHFSDIKEENFAAIANALTKIDGILKYNYNKGMESELNYEDYSYYDVSIYLSDLKYRNLIHINFSTSESERWTEKHLYESIYKQYQSNVKKPNQDIENEERKRQKKKEQEEREIQKQEEQKKIEQTIKLDMLNYLSTKYDETFIVDESSLFVIDETTDTACFLLHCERLPSVTIEVLGNKKTDGTYSYTDNFNEGKRYKDNN